MPTNAIVGRKFIATIVSWNSAMYLADFLILDLVLPLGGG